MRRNLRFQCGLTLAELMVAMALGLAVLLGAGALLVSSTRAHAALVEAAGMDDSGRYAMDALARAVRMASHADWEKVPAPDPEAPARIAGLDAASLSHSGAAIDAPLPDAVNGSDVLALRFPGSGAAPDGDGATVDCAGFPVHRDEEGWSIFYVARNAQGEAELRCKYRGEAGWSSDAVAGGVDSFQVLYGLDGDEDGAPERYLNASALAALDAGLLLTGITPDERARELRVRTHWKRVTTVRVALLLRGPILEPGRGEAVVHELFGPDHGASFSDTDRGTRLAEAQLGEGSGARMRKVYGVTVALPAVVPVMLPPAPPVAPDPDDPEEPNDPGDPADPPPPEPPDSLAPAARSDSRAQSGAAPRPAPARLARALSAPMSASWRSGRP